MTAPRTLDRDLGVRDLGFACLAVLSVALTVVAQGLWIVIADTTGFDAAVPDLLFTSVLPALTVAVPPAAVGAWLYPRRVAAAAAAVVFVAAAVLSTVTIDFFRLCGPGC